MGLEANLPLPTENTRIVRHPADRVLSRLQTQLLCGCCSCCCCCLHTVGGLVGALTTPGPQPTAATAASVDMRPRFWILLIGILLATGVPISILMEGGWFGMALGIALFMPLGQLFVSLLVLISTLWVAPDQRAATQRQLGKLTLRTFLGTVVGGAIMVGGSILLSALRPAASLLN